MVEVNGYVGCVSTALHRPRLFKELANGRLAERHVLIVDLLNILQCPFFLQY